MRTRLPIRATIPVALSLLVLVACESRPAIGRIEDGRIERSAELIAALEAGDAEQRSRAALAMGRIQSPSYAGKLARAAGEGDERVRIAALFALGQLGMVSMDRPAVVFETLGSALNDGSVPIVAAAVEALGKLAPPGAADELARLLEHPSPEIRVEAAHALLRTRFVPTWRGDSREPPELPARAVDALARALGDESPQVRWAAAHAFSRYGQAEALPALLESIGDDDEWVRLFSVRAIGRSGEPAALDGLVPALQDPSARVRAETVAAIDALDGYDRLPASLDDDPSFHVRAALARASGRSETDEAQELLHGLERDASPGVRSAAIDALARRLGVDYRETLRAQLEDEAWTTRVAAAGALAHLGNDGLELADAALQDRDRRVVAAALESLGELEGVEERIVAALESDDLGVRGTAVGLLGARDDPRKLDWLTTAYDSSAGVEWIEIREAVAAALEQVEQSEALLRRIESEDAAPSVRSRARRALSARGVEIDAGAAPPTDPSPFLGVTYETDPIVVLETTKGTMEIRCLADEAPIHVANFVKLVGDGYYDGLIWHRVVPNFVIQGGDPRGDGWGGPGYTLRDEINRVRYLRGAVGMPKAGKDTGGGQLFVTHVPTPHLDGNYTIFGQVVSGLDVIDLIEVGDRIERAYLK